MGAGGDPTHPACKLLQRIRTETKPEPITRHSGWHVAPHHTHTHARTHTRTHTHTHTYTHARTHTRAHARTHQQPPLLLPGQVPLAHVVHLQPASAHEHRQCTHTRILYSHWAIPCARFTHTTRCSVPTAPTPHTVPVPGVKEGLGRPDAGYAMRTNRRHALHGAQCRG